MSRFLRPMASVLGPGLGVELQQLLVLLPQSAMLISLSPPTSAHRHAVAIRRHRELQRFAACFDGALACS